MSELPIDGSPERGHAPRAPLEAAVGKSTRGKVTNDPEVEGILVGVPAAFAGEASLQ